MTIAQVLLYFRNLGVTYLQTFVSSDTNRGTIEIANGAVSFTICKNKSVLMVMDIKKLCLSGMIIKEDIG